MADVEEEEAPSETVDDQNNGNEAEEDLKGEGEDGDEEQVEEEQESEEEKDLFELLDQEYLEVIKEIDTQNLVIQELKAKSCQLMYKKCKTYEDKQEYKRLRACQDQGDIHLRSLVNRAIQLQNFGSPRQYRDIEMELTDVEQSYFFTALQSTFSGTCPTPSEDESCQGCCFSDSSSDSDDGLCCS